MGPSILYATETLYDLSETEIRQIERIEESYWRTILKTPRICPLSEIYFSIGKKPARFEIMKRQMLFLKNILEQDDKLKTKAFFMTQFQNRARGDIELTMLKDIIILKINLSFKQIEHIKLSTFKSLINQHIDEKALLYLSK